MAQISGIPVENITAMRGVDATSVLSIGGISTSSIPGYPSACVTRTFGYTNLFSDPPTSCAVFMENPINYLYNGTLNVLYGARNPCGSAYAREGYYSDGVDIYVWTKGGKRGWIFIQIGTCG